MTRPSMDIQEEYDRICKLLNEPDEYDDLQEVVKEYRRKVEPEGSPYEVYNWNER